MLPDSFSERPDPLTSFLYFILFTGYLLSRESNTNCLCFGLRSFHYQAPIYLSEPLHLYTPSRQLRSSADIEVFRIVSFDRTQRPVVSDLSLTRLHQSGTNSLFLSVILPSSVLSNFSWIFFSFQKPFLQSHCPEKRVCVRASITFSKISRCIWRMRRTLGPVRVRRSQYP